MENDISQTNSKSPEDQTLDKILNELNIKGEITNSAHPLVNYIKNNKNKMNSSRIKNSYIKNAEWKEYKKDKDDIYLFRIVNRINKNVKSLIINEYKIHEENPDLNYCSPQFICYYFSNFLNFSLFKFTDYYTFEEILEKKVVKDFSQKDLLLSVSETINVIQFEEKNKYYICPFLTPSNLLYTESSGKEYFNLTELFLESDSIDKEIEVELNITSEWLVYEFQSPKSKITFASNICCIGYLFYKIIYGVNPFQDEKERIEKKIPKLKEDYQYRELIENCINIKYKERWSINVIQEYINKNIYEEKGNCKNEPNINTIEKNQNEEILDNKIDNNEKISQNENEDNLSIEIEKNIEKKSVEDDKEKIMEGNKKENDNIIEFNKTLDIENIGIEEKLEKNEKIKNELLQKGSEEETVEDNEESLKIEKAEELQKTKEENEKMEKKLLELQQKINERKQKEIEERKQKELEEKKQKEIEERKKKAIEEKNKKEKIEKEKEEKERIEYEKSYKEQLKKQQELKEKIEKIEKEEEEKERLKKEEEEKLERERKENERIENEKKERERIEHEQKERERIQKEKEEKERIKIEREKSEKLEKELLEKERIRKEKEKKERAEKEKQEKQEKHASKFPKGITSSPRENDLKEEIKFIHLDIIFKSNEKQIEIFDIFAPKKKGYKVINFEENKYFSVFPF